MVLVGIFGKNILLDFVHSLNQGFSTGVPRDHRVPRDVARGSERDLLG
jgi:hypothetical protein